MMSNCAQKLETQMFPYGDGSGFEHTVAVIDREDGCRIVCIYQIDEHVEIDADKWPAIRDEIDRHIAHADGLANVRDKE